MLLVELFSVSGVFEVAVDVSLGVVDELDDFAFVIAPAFVDTPQGWSDYTLIDCMARGAVGLEEGLAVLCPEGSEKGYPK
jgi:hypothetical protein